MTIYHEDRRVRRTRRLILPGAFVNTTSVQDRKRAALECHASQREFLDTTQGMSSYVKTMDDLSRMLGRMSGRFRHAEGWRRHLHWGFCDRDADPLRQALGRRFLINRRYEQALEHGA